MDVPFDRQVVAHSDGDVLVHALMDAMLGALALGDIGQHFPDNDPRYAGADSLTLLGMVRDLLLARGHEVSNVDMTLIAERPRVRDYVDAMRATLAGCLRIPTSYVSVKATTSEGLGFTGRGEGIAAHAVVLLVAQ